MANSSGRTDRLSNNERLLVAVAVGLLLLLILVAGVFGGPGGLFGFVFFLLNLAAVIVTVLVLWFLYRIAVGVERIADAQERMVRTNEIRARSGHGSGGTGRTDRADRADRTDRTDRSGQDDRRGQGNRGDRTGRSDRDDRSDRW